jgi:hypothetical protein
MSCSPTPGGGVGVLDGTAVAGALGSLNPVAAVLTLARAIDTLPARQLPDGIEAARVLDEPVQLLTGPAHEFAAARAVTPAELETAVPFPVGRRRGVAPRSSGAWSPSGHGYPSTRLSVRGGR